MYKNYLLIAVATLLLIMSILELNFDNISEGPFSKIIGSLIFILLGIWNIRRPKKKEEDNTSS